MLNANVFEHHHIVCTGMMMEYVIKLSIPRSKCARGEIGTNELLDMLQKRVKVPETKKSTVVPYFRKRFQDWAI